MEVKRLVLGALATNTYLLKEGDEVILIDPASKAERLIEEIGDNHLLAILLTHGHFDHIRACDELHDKYNVPVYLMAEDDMLAHDKYQGRDFNLYFYLTCKTVPLKEGKMKIGPFQFEVIHTPGHTEGSVLFKFDNCLFTGDTLFKGSVGRTDLEGGNQNKLNQSLKYIKNLNPNLIIYPGHEDVSVLEDELKYNYYLQ